MNKKETLKTIKNILIGLGIIITILVMVKPVNPEEEQEIQDCIKQGYTVNSCMKGAY